MNNQNANSSGNYRSSIGNNSLNLQPSNQRLFTEEDTRKTGRLRSIEQNIIRPSYARPSNTEGATYIKSNSQGFNEEDNRKVITEQNELMNSRGKTVMGIKPVYDFDSKEEDRRDEIAKRKFGEINENLDLFRVELTNTLRKINKQQNKLKVDYVLEEINEFKDSFLHSIQMAERKKEEDNEFIMKEIRKLKTQIERNYEESQNSYKVIRNFQDEIFDFEKQITSQISDLEKHQNEQFNRIYGLLLNLSVMQRETKGGKMKDITDGLEKDDDEELLKELEEKQNLNKIRQEKEIPENKEKTTELKENYLIQRRNEQLKNMQKIKLKIANSSKKKVKTKAGQLRAYLHITHFISKSMMTLRETRVTTKIESLKLFLNYYKDAYLSFEDWIRSTSKAAFNSIKQTDSLILDMSEMKSIRADDTITTFKQLITRLEGIINPLTSSIETYPFDLNALIWLRSTMTPGNIIPFNYYYNFVLSRLQTQNGELYRLEVPKDLFLILCFFLIVHILIFRILLPEMNGTSNSNMKRNYKMIASVFYHIMIEFWGAEMKPKILISNFAKHCSQQLEAPSIASNPNVNKDAPMSYKKAVKTLSSKRENEDNSLREQARKLVKPTEELYNNVKKDGNPNDVAELSSVLFKRRDIDSYFKLAKENKYSLMKSIGTLVQEFLTKLLNHKERTNL